jgi:hypothetical protein
MNSRRLTLSMGSPSEPAVPAYRPLRLLRKQWQVLGPDLNRSELAAGKAAGARALLARWLRLAQRAGGRSENLDGAISRGAGAARKEFAF